jgi:hypothetical protein
VTLTNAGYGELKDVKGNRCENDWGAGIGITNSPYAYTTIKNNYVHEQWGEGISSTRITQNSNANHCGYATIEDNIVWKSRRVDVYLNLTEGNTVRRNFLIGAKDSKFASTTLENRSWNQKGVWVNSEERSTPLTNVSNNNLVYGNFVVGHYVGIGLSTSYLNGKMENQFFYNNTAIGNRINYEIGENLYSYQTKNIVFKNNISYCPPDTICKDVNRDPIWFDDKILGNYNAWTQKPKNWGSENDIITNNNWKKLSGWQALNSIPGVYDFMPTSGNPVIGNGFKLFEPYNQLVSLEKTRYQTDPLEIEIGVILTNEEKKLWDIGALQTQSGTPIDLNPPKLFLTDN